MYPPNGGSLRDRRRAELRARIQDAANRLFAERGFGAVTTEDIAATAGVSISTYFRYAPTKEYLLVAPVRQAVAKVVASYGARPPDESAAEAFINLMVENIVGRADQEATQWRQAVLTAPDLVNSAALISEDDDRYLIQLVAMRMSVDGATDIRPTLLVHTGLATASTVLRRWLATDPQTNPPLDIQLKQALELTLAGFD